MQKAFSLTTAALVLVLIAATAFAAGDAIPRTGTWQLNLALSKFDPGPGPQKQTRVDRQTSEGLTATVTGVLGNGGPIDYRYVPAFDGKEVSIVGPGVPSGADSISIRRVDARTIESTLKRAGKVVLTRVEVVAADGKRLTITSQGLDASGKPASNVTVYDRS